MEAILGFLAAFNAFLDTPLVKYAALLLAGKLMKLNGAVNNYVIPIVLGISSAIVSVLNLLFPPAAPVAFLFPLDLVFPALAHAADGAAAAVAKVPWWKSLLFDAIIPWLASVGTHSSFNSTAKLARGEIKRH